MANGNSNQANEDALSAITDLYTEWCENGSRRTDSSEILESVGEVLSEAGFLEDEGTEAEDEDEA